MILLKIEILFRVMQDLFLCAMHIFMSFDSAVCKKMAFWAHNSIFDL